MSKTVEEITKIQKSNIREYKDLFEKIKSVSEMNYPTPDKAQGARMACGFIRNYLLNREITKK